MLKHLLIMLLLTLVSNSFGYYNASNGKWLSRDPIGEYVKMGSGVLDYKHNLLYGFVENDPINSIDFLGEWKYRFITKTTKDEKYGHIYATSEGPTDSLEELAKYWDFGEGDKWPQLLNKLVKGKSKANKKNPKVGTKKGCTYDIFDIMPEYYKDRMRSRRDSGVSCGYAALAYHGLYANKAGGADDQFKTASTVFNKFTRANGEGLAGDIWVFAPVGGRLNGYTIVHYAIFLAKDENGDSYFYQKDTGNANHEIVDASGVDYMSTNGVAKYRRK